MESPSSRTFPRSSCSQAELERLFEVASLYRATGAICDVGCGSGGSTYALAEGLRKAGYQPNHQIEAYDWFELGDGPHSNYATRTKFWKNLSDNAEYITIHAADLREQSDPDPKPTEILFIDAEKSADLSRSIHRRFLPRVSSNGVILNQDFGMPSLPWIHCSFSVLANFSKSIDFVDDMVILQMQEAVPQEAVERLTHDQFSIDERHDLIESWRRLVSGKTDASGESYSSVLDLSHAYAELWWGDLGAAADLAKELEGKPHTQRFQRYIDSFHANLSGPMSSGSIGGQARREGRAGLFRRLWHNRARLFRGFKLAEKADP